MNSSLISEEQSEAALRRAVDEGRITLTPEQEAALRNPDGTWRKTNTPVGKAVTLVRRLFQPRVGNS